MAGGEGGGSALLDPQLREFGSETDPFIDKILEELVVLDLFLDGLDVPFSDETSSVFAFSSVGELIVGAVFVGRIGLALAVGSATDIELFRESPDAEVTQLTELFLDLTNASLDGLNGVRHGAKDSTFLLCHEADSSIILSASERRMAIHAKNPEPPVASQADRH